MNKQYFIQLKRFVLPAVCLFLCWTIAGCYVEESTCVSCHTDEEKLKEVADPIEYEESSEGG